MGKYLHVVTWARWRVIDPFSPEHFTIFTASILKPTWEFPLACASMSICKGLRKLFMRLPYEALEQVFVIPDEYKVRLAGGYKFAQEEAALLQAQQKALHKMSNLAPGSHAVRTDTGEIIAEAERIVSEGTDEQFIC